MEYDVPESYWYTAVHSPFWDTRTRTWGVTDQYPNPITDPLMVGLDKSIAYAISYLLNGDTVPASRVISRLSGNRQYPRVRPFVPA